MYVILSSAGRFISAWLYSVSTVCAMEWAELSGISCSLRSSQSEIKSGEVLLATNFWASILWPMHFMAASPTPSLPESCCAKFLSSCVLVTFLLLWQNTMTKATYRRVYWGLQFQRVFLWPSWWEVWWLAGRHSAQAVVESSHLIHKEVGSGGKCS